MTFPQFAWLAEGTGAWRAWYAAGPTWNGKPDLTADPLRAERFPTRETCLAWIRETIPCAALLEPVEHGYV